MAKKVYIADIKNPLTHSCYPFKMHGLCRYF